MTKDAATRRSAPLLLTLVVTMAVGAVAFALGVARHPGETWKIFLVNFVFWSGLAMGAVIFAAILELTSGGWARLVRPVAESFVRFLPISFVLFLILLAGAPALYPWIEHPPPARAAWFHFSAFAWRDTLAIALLYTLALVFTGRSRRAAEGRGPSPALGRLASALIIVYALVFSLLAIDLVMSLDPAWASTLFPAYFFMGNLYAGIAAVSLAAALDRGPSGTAWLDEARAYDLGKLLLGFCLLWTYLFWSQFLVIWYGNLPEDLRFLTVRSQGSWRPMAWAVVALCFVVPFVALLSRAAKRPRPLVALASVCLAGVWLERFVLIMPSTTSGPSGVTGAWLGWSDLFVTLGFLALFVIAQIVRPIVPRGIDRRSPDAFRS